jgi:hypothetical protein
MKIKIIIDCLDKEITSIHPVRLMFLNLETGIKIFRPEYLISPSASSCFPPPHGVLLIAT